MRHESRLRSQPSRSARARGAHGLRPLRGRRYQGAGHVGEAQGGGSVRPGPPTGVGRGRAAEQRGSHEDGDAIDEAGLEEGAGQLGARLPRSTAVTSRAKRRAARSATSTRPSARLAGEHRHARATRARPAAAAARPRATATRTRARLPGPEHARRERQARVAVHHHAIGLARPRPQQPHGRAPGRRRARVPIPTRWRRSGSAAGAPSRRAASPVIHRERAIEGRDLAVERHRPLER